MRAKAKAASLYTTLSFFYAPAAFAIKSQCGKRPSYAALCRSFLQEGCVAIPAVRRKPPFDNLIRRKEGKSEIRFCLPFRGWRDHKAFQLVEFTEEKLVLVKQALFSLLPPLPAGWHFCVHFKKAPPGPLKEKHKSKNVQGTPDGAAALHDILRCRAALRGCRRSTAICDRVD